jgi:hypothetical protein
MSETKGLSLQQEHHPGKIHSEDKFGRIFGWLASWAARAFRKPRDGVADGDFMVSHNCVLDTVGHLQERTSPHRSIFGPRESDRPGRSFFGHMFTIGIIVGDIEDKPCLSG